MSEAAGIAPNITPVEWLSAKEVLGGEASDFTPWLQLPESMLALGEALKIEDLTTVAMEHNVLGKRLDILATALDENAEEIPVCIENQYGQTDADHLGRLIAYLAQQDRGRAVWIVEDAHDAFVAAVRFLNRTSSEEVGYYLVKIRFTHGSAGSHQVHFEVLAAPIAWEKTGKARGGGMRPINSPKVEYLERIYEIVEPTLAAAGFPSMNTHARGSYLWIKWPADLWFVKYARRIDIKVTQEAARVSLYVHSLPTREENTAAVQILEHRYAAAIAERLPPATELKWQEAGPGQRELVLAELVGQGYVGGDPAQAAEWAGSVVVAWLEVMRSAPIHDLDDLVDQAVLDSSDSGEDDL